MSSTASSARSSSLSFNHSSLLLSDSHLAKCFLAILLWSSMVQITERLRDPRGLRRGTFSGAGPRNAATNGARPRGFVRPVRLSHFHFNFIIIFCVFRKDGLKLDCFSTGALKIRLCRQIEWMEKISLPPKDGCYLRSSRYTIYATCFSCPNFVLLSSS